MVSDVLRRWGLDRAVQNAQQCASELVTDALRNGSPPIHLVIKRWTDSIQVTVIDWNERHDGDGFLAGYGEPWLRHCIVEGLATRRGVEALSRGRAAWFDIAVDPPDRELQR
jgi:hypothetical protein